MIRFTATLIFVSGVLTNPIAPQRSYQQSSFGGSGLQGGFSSLGQPAQGQQDQGAQGGGDLPSAIGLISQIDPTFQGILYIDVQGGPEGMLQMGGSGPQVQPQGGYQSSSYGGLGGGASFGAFGQPQGGQDQAQGLQGDGQQGQGPQGGGGDLPAAIGLIGQLQPNFQGILYIDVTGGQSGGPPAVQQGIQQESRRGRQQYFGV